MAQAKTITFGQQTVLIGDGGGPEIFSAPCGLTTLNLAVNIAVSTVNVPDCDDPDLPSWLVSDEVSKQMVITGNGVLDTDANQMWRDWLFDGGEKNIRWLKDGLAADGGGYWQAPGILTTYSEGGQKGQRWTNSIGVTLNGRPTFTPAT